MSSNGFNFRKMRSRDSSNKTVAELKKGVSAHRVTTRYSTLVPLLIILGTLIATTTRDFLTFRGLKRDVIRQMAEEQPLLSRSGQEVAWINSMKEDLVKLSYSDPVAARIVTEYFPASAPAKVSEPETTEDGVSTVTNPAPINPIPPQTSAVHPLSPETSGENGATPTPTPSK